MAFVGFSIGRSVVVPNTIIITARRRYLYFSTIQSSFALVLVSSPFTSYPKRHARPRCSTSGCEIQDGSCSRPSAKEGPIQRRSVFIIHIRFFFFVPRRADRPLFRQALNTRCLMLWERVLMGLSAPPYTDLVVAKSLSRRSRRSITPCSACELSGS